MVRMTLMKNALIRLLLLAPASLPCQPALSQESIKRGEYLAAITDCTGCHTLGALQGKPDNGRYLAGSDVGLELPGLGIFYPI
jgi:hypothetical protein